MINFFRVLHEVGFLSETIDQAGMAFYLVLV